MHSSRILACGLEFLLACAALALAVTPEKASKLRAAVQLPTRRQLHAYEGAITPAVRDWGSAETLGMRPTLAAHASGQGVPSVDVGRKSRAWAAALGHDRVVLRTGAGPRTTSGCYSGLRRGHGGRPGRSHLV